MNEMGGGNWGALERLSDAALLAQVSRVSRAHRQLTVELVVHLAEIDHRKLYLLREAKPSMFAYCVERLGFSEDEACRRIEAARLGRKWPVIFSKIAESTLSLSVIGKLKPFLNDVVREPVSTLDFVVGLARLRESSGRPRTFVRGAASRRGWSYPNPRISSVASCSHSARGA